jgi:hypothetical protein
MGSRQYSEPEQIHHVPIDGRRIQCEFFRVPDIHFWIVVRYDVAPVAALTELADVVDSKSTALTGIPVRVRGAAIFTSQFLAQFLMCIRKMSRQDVYTTY